MNQTLPFYQFNTPNTFFNQQPQMNQFNIEQLKSKYTQQNQPANSFYNKAFTMNPSMNPNNFFFGLQDNMRYNQNPMNNFNTMNQNFIPHMQMNNNNNMLINPRDEIERIKMKYFSIENANKTNEFKNTLSTIEDKIQKYKEQIYSSPNDPISAKYNITKPLTVNENSKPLSTQKFEINRVNDIEINTNDNNDLLLSKMSWIEGKISTSSNKFNFNNNSINMLEANKNNDITTNNQNVSYTYSNSCKSEKEEKEENYNYDEVIPIIDKVSKLKEFENINEEEHYHTEEEEEEDHKSISKQIVSNVIDEVSSKLSEKSQKEEEENKVDYLNVKDLEVDKVNTKKEISQPKVILSNKKQATLPKKKLISFEEFLSLNDE